MKIRSTVLTAALIGLMTLAGCSTTTDAVDTTDSGSSADTGSEFSQGDTPEVTPVVDTPSVSLATAYFDYDRSEIRNDMRDVLKLNAEALQVSGATAMIEGHADERGSEEYNLALGERRAESVRKYMTALGVASSQLRIVSYGESKPAVSGHDDNAWRLNRRAEFIAR